MDFNNQLHPILIHQLTFHIGGKVNGGNRTTAIERNTNMHFRKAWGH
jgi:hypothetical protein